MPMRVCVVLGAILPELLKLWRACNDAGIDVTIIGTTRDVYEGRWPWRPRTPSGVATIVLDPMTPGPLLQRGQVWWLYRSLDRALRKARPDVVHVVSEPWGGLVLQTLATRGWRRGSPAVCVQGADNIYQHGSWAERMIRQLVVRRVFPRLDGFVSWSVDGVRAAKEAGLGAIPTAIIPAVVPDPTLFRPATPEERSELRRDLRLPLEADIVGFLGRLTAEKGILDLIEAIALSRTRTPFLAVWGAGPLAETVANALDSGRIEGRLLGSLKLSEAPKAYRACDVIAVPSRNTGSWKEQFGRVLVEAMLTENGIVAYGTGAIPEVVNDAAVLVDEGDISGLSEAIIGLLDEPLVRARLGSAARQRALNRYHPLTLAEQMSHFWDAVLSPSL